MTYDFFKKYGVDAFSSERCGFFGPSFDGVSNGDYGCFNVCHYVEDIPEHVSANRRLLCNYLGIGIDKLFMPRQTHSNNVVCIDNVFLNLEEDDKQKRLNCVDALITNVKGICIGINTADCVPILLFDPNHEVVAAIHAGWRGVVSHIARNTISIMSNKYNCSPADIVCAVGPHISVDAYEVGDELKQNFTDAGYDVNDIFEYATIWEKAHLNLSKAIEIELLSSGILVENIEFANVCTYCHYDQYFSARRLGIKSGRIFSGVILR